MSQEGHSLSAAPESLETRAERGDVEAQLALGRLCETRDNSAAARGWFAKAAKAGSIAGLRALGISLLTQKPIEGDAGVNIIRAAAARGDGEAAHVCGMIAAGDAALPDRWSVARQCLEIAAERGFDFARTQLDFIADTQCDFGIDETPGREIFAAPSIRVLEGFASPAECDWFIARARPRLHRAVVYDDVNGGAKPQDARSNSSAEFNVAQSDIVLMHLRARIAAACAIDDLEMSSVLHYAPGQEFRPHFDFLDPANLGTLRDLQIRGQRGATFLIYLNEEYEGGETAFPNLDWRFRGRKGDALLFRNLTPSGEPDRQTLHAGTPPTSGEKWLFSQWLRVPPVL